MQMDTSRKAEPQDDAYERYIETYTQYKERPFKILWGFLRGNRGKTLLATLFFVLRQSPVWIISIVTANIINIATSPQDYAGNAIILNAAIALIFLLQNIGTAYIQTSIYSKVCRSVERNLRGAMVRKVQQLSIGFLHTMKSGQLLSKIMRDVENVVTLLQQGYFQLVCIVLDIAVAVIVTAYNSPTVLLFFLILVPIAAGVMRIFREPIRKRNQDFRARMEETHASMAEMLDMVPVTRAHGLGDIEMRRMERRLNTIWRAGYRLDTMNILFDSSSWVLFRLFSLLCLVFTGTLAYMGRISVGEVVLYQNYFGLIVSSVGSFIALYPQFTKGMESVRSIGSILSATEAERSTGELSLGILQGKVSFEDVTYGYPDTANPVLDGLSLDVQSGECVAFVGSSGAGKTTLLNLLIGFLEPTGGNIYIDDKDLNRLDLKEYRSQIAVVPQSTILFSGTLYENITYGVENVSREFVNEMLAGVGLDTFVASLPQGLDTQIEENGSNLSGGQKQRISIVRALVRKPHMIIFDEATSALDSEAEQKVQEAVNYMASRCTVFMVAHRLSTVKNADKIVVLQKGHVAECGSYQQLMEQRGVFYHMKKMQE